MPCIFGEIQLPFIRVAQLKSAGAADEGAHVPFWHDPHMEVALLRTRPHWSFFTYLQQCVRLEGPSNTTSLVVEFGQHAYSTARFKMTSQPTLRSEPTLHSRPLPHMNCA
jgi:hypothetical protein